jgi:hypothetical protein
MAGKLKLYHKLLPFLFIPICLVIAVGWGRTAFATLTQRSGLYGDLYSYYHLSPAVFFFYELIVSVVAFGFIFFQVYYLVTRNDINLTKTFKWFGLFIALFLVAEYFLYLRFTGKG